MGKKTNFPFEVCASQSTVWTYNTDVRLRIGSHIQHNWINRKKERKRGRETTTYGWNLRTNGRNSCARDEIAKTTRKKENKLKIRWYFVIVCLHLFVRVLFLISNRFSYIFDSQDQQHTFSYVFTEDRQFLAKGFFFNKPEKWLKSWQI